MKILKNNYKIILLSCKIKLLINMMLKDIRIKLNLEN